MRNNNSKIIRPEVKESSEGSLKTSKVSNQYVIQYNEKQDEFFRESFHREFIASHGIRKALSEHSKTELKVVHHLEKKHPCDIHIGSNNTFKSVEIKVNPNALTNGCFDVELYRSTSKKGTGLIESALNGTEMFCFAIPSIKNCASEYQHFQNRFYMIETKKLVHKYFREKFEGDIEYTFNPEETAVLWQCPIDADFKSFHLYWEEFSDLDEPDVFKEIFNGR